MIILFISQLFMCYKRRMINYFTNAILRLAHDCWSKDLVSTHNRKEVILYPLTSITKATIKYLKKGEIPHDKNRKAINIGVILKHKMG